MRKMTKHEWTKVFENWCIENAEESRKFEQELKRKEDIALFIALFFIALVFVTGFSMAFIELFS